MKASKQVVIASASLLIVAAPSLGDDQIHIVDLPIELESSFIESVVYDNTGESIAMVAFANTVNDGRGVLYQYELGEWRIVAQDSDAVPVRWIGGIADSGSTIAFSNLGEAHRISGGGLERLPSSWVGADGEPVSDAWIFSTALSGDGQTVGVYGFDPAVGGDVPLVWRGGKTLESLEIGLPGSGIDSFITAMNHDGSVIAGQSVVAGQINNFKNYSQVRVPWVWRDGSLKYIDIPNTDGLDEVAYPRCVSADGTTVAGSSSQPLIVRPHLASRLIANLNSNYAMWDAWVWSEDEGVTIISDPRFELMAVFDISANGHTLLIGCQSDSGNTTGFYFWTREEGFLNVEDHLRSRGLLGAEEYFQCHAISDDARTLMGWYSSPEVANSLAIVELD